MHMNEGWRSAMREERKKTNSDSAGGTKGSTKPAQMILTHFSILKQIKTCFEIEINNMQVTCD